MSTSTLAPNIALAYPPLADTFLQHLNKSLSFSFPYKSGVISLKGENVIFTPNVHKVDPTEGMIIFTMLSSLSHYVNMSTGKDGTPIVVGYTPNSNNVNECVDVILNKITMVKAKGIVPTYKPELMGVNYLISDVGDLATLCDGRSFSSGPITVEGRHGNFEAIVASKLLHVFKYKPKRNVPENCKAGVWLALQSLSKVVNGECGAILEWYTPDETIGNYYIKNHDEILTRLKESAKLGDELTSLLKQLTDIGGRK